MSRFVSSARRLRSYSWIWMGALLMLLACASEESARLNLLFITLDTTRQDHLQLYGYPRETSPELAELAAESVVFNSAFAQETSTAPSHASMFTGQYPFDHGVMANEFRLAPDSRTLAELLRASGYRTAGFVSGWTMSARTSGLDRGFEVYDDEVDDVRRNGAETVLRAIEWLGEEASNPFFLFVHLFDAHGPYNPPVEFQAMFQSGSPGPSLALIPPYQQMTDAEGRAVTTANPYIDLYDGAIRFTDSLVATLLAAIDRQSTVIVVAGDHGETIAERYWSVDHGGHVTDEQTRIPLLVSAPDLEPRRIDAMVETVDLMPTLIDLLGLEPPVGESISGRSLVPLTRGQREQWRQLVFSSAKAVSDRYADRGYELNPKRKIYAARSQRWKLVNYPGVGEDYWELFDLQVDPDETENVAASNPEVVHELRTAMGNWLRQARQTEFRPVELSEEERRKLLALGYIE